MLKSAKLILATTLGSAALLGGCATGPYYDNYGYNGYYGNGYGPGYGYAYDPYYVAPSVGLGFGYTYSDGDYYRGGRYRDRDGSWRERREYNREWRGSSDTTRNEADMRNNNGTPLWSQGNTYRGTGPNYDPQKDHGQYSPG